MGFLLAGVDSRLILRGFRGLYDTDIGRPGRTVDSPVRINLVVKGLALILVPAVVSLLALSGPPSAEATKYCDPVKVHHKVYSVSGKGLKCKLQRRWAERYIRRGIKPKGWKCSSGGCSDRSSRAYFVWFRPFDRFAPASSSGL